MEESKEVLGLSKPVSAETLKRNKHNLKGFY